VLNGVPQRLFYTVTVSFQLYTGGSRGLPPAVTAGPASTGVVLRAGTDVHPPQRIGGSDPKYPDSAKSKRIEGTVVLELRILPDGRVANARVVKSIKELDKAAVDAAMKWEFVPTLVNGTRVSVLYQVEVPFSIPR